MRTCIPAIKMENSYKPFLVEYTHEGSKWSLAIHATSFEDAQQRLWAIQFGNVLGEIAAEIPARLGVFAKTAVILRNLFKS